MPSESYMRDLVLTELQRAWPDGILLTELQDKTGLGTSDLRDTLTFLQDEGAAAQDNGKVFLEREEGDDETQRPAVRVESAVPVDEAETPAGDEDDERVEEAPAPVVAAAGDDQDQYRGSINLRVTFTPPAGPFEGDQQPDGDEVARQIMYALQERVREAVEATFPGAGIDVTVEALEALKPRSVSIEP